MLYYIYFFVVECNIIVLFAIVHRYKIFSLWLPKWFPKFRVNIFGVISDPKQVYLSKKFYTYITKKGTAYLFSILSFFNGFVQGIFFLYQFIESNKKYTIATCKFASNFLLKVEFGSSFLGLCVILRGTKKIMRFTFFKF